MHEHNSNTVLSVQMDHVVLVLTNMTSNTVRTDEEMMARVEISLIKIQNIDRNRPAYNLPDRPPKA